MDKRAEIEFRRIRAGDGSSVGGGRAKGTGAGTWPKAEDALRRGQPFCDGCLEAEKGAKNESRKKGLEERETVVAHSVVFEQGLRCGGKGSGGMLRRRWDSGKLAAVCRLLV